MEESEKMTGIAKQKDEVIAKRNDLSRKFQAVQGLKLSQPGGKEARAQSLTQLETMIQEANSKITSLDEEFEVALVEHLAGLTFSGEEKK